jgi:hypothetical protein
MARGSRQQQTPPREDASYAQAMMDVFGGAERAHGTHGEPVQKPGTLKWEIKSTARTLREPVTTEIWEKHLTGQRPLGVIVIREDGHSRWGSIDYDVYDANLLEMVDRVEKMKLPLVPCRSKSGGLHLFLFSDEWIAAETMRGALQHLSGRLGLSGSEIFPKQTQILRERGDLGNWMVMPYFGGTFGGKLREQVGVKRTGAEMSIGEFVRACVSRRVPSDEMRRMASAPQPSPARATRNGDGRISAGTGAPFQDGPPCLQTLAENKVPRGQQSNALLMMGTYYKRAFPDEWQQKLEEAGRAFLDPPSSAEGMVSVTRSLEKRDYNYQCKTEPMCSHCNVAVCRTRQFGVGNEGDYPEISDLRKLDVDPPIWFVGIGEKTVELTTRELQMYQMFQHACMERAGVCFLNMKQSDWITVINEAMPNATPLEAPPDTGERGRFRELLEEFCTNRQRGERVEDILSGRPWQSPDNERHYFRLRDLQAFLHREGLRDMQRVRVAQRLKELGGGDELMEIKGRKTRTWWVPDSVLEFMPELNPPDRKESGI